MEPGTILYSRPRKNPYPYTTYGSHPGVVKVVWDVIGSSLPEDCRCLIYGTPALVHPKIGVILAFCNGMAYCVRLSKNLMFKARIIGAETYTKWSDGSDMDTKRDLGDYWVLGFSRKYLVKWCPRVYWDLENKYLKPSD